MADRPPGFFEGTGMPDPGWWEALWPDPAGVLRAVGVKPGMDVVDLCCGDGWFTLPLAGNARSVIAIDIDAKLLDAAKVRFAERGGEQTSHLSRPTLTNWESMFVHRLIMCSLQTPSMAFQTALGSRAPSATF